MARLQPNHVAHLSLGDYSEWVRWCTPNTSTHTSNFLQLGRADLDFLPSLEVGILAEETLCDNLLKERLMLRHLKL